MSDEQKVDPSVSHYDSVYSRDNPAGRAHGWIQWKGTDVCIDLHCECGHHGHLHGYFLYYYECPECHKLYALGQNVALIRLTSEEESYVRSECASVIQTDEDDWG
jgi:hypothetical protein